MSLEQYNVSTNPFLALSKGIKSGDRKSTNLGHALILQGAHHAQVMEHLDRSHQLEEQRATSARSHEAEMQGRQQSFESGQTAATFAHQKELAKTIYKGAQSGTTIKFAAGDVKAEYTKRQPKIRTVATPAAPVAEPTAAPAAEPKTQKYAHRDPVTKKISGYKDYPQESLSPAKSSATKKSAFKKRK
jgi:hypothetical protein